MIYTYIKCLLFALWIALMFYLSCTAGFCQAPAYFHDASLDTIANNVLILDSDLNNKGIGGTNNSLTESQYTNDTPTVWFGMMGAGMTNYSSVNVSNGNLSLTISNSQMATWYNSLMTSATRIATNTAAGLASNIATAFNPFVTNISTNVMPNQVDGTVNAGGSVWSQELPNGDVFALDFNILDDDDSNHTIATFSPVVRSLWLVVFSFMIMVWLYGDFAKEFNYAFGQTQVQGTRQAVFGWNLSVFTALGYNVLTVFAITSAISVLVGASLFTTIIYEGRQFFASGFLTSFHDTLTTPDGEGGTVNIVGNIYDSICVFFPITGLMRLFVIYIVERINIGVTFLVLRALIRSLPV